MRRLYIGPSRDAVQMESVCGFRPGCGYAYRTRLDSRLHASGRTPSIRRSIWSDLLYFPGPTVGRTYTLELLCLYLYGEVVWAGVWLQLTFCHGHVVVGRPRYALMVRAPAPRRRIEVAVYASGNF